MFTVSTLYYSINWQHLLISFCNKINFKHHQHQHRRWNNNAKYPLRLDKRQQLQLHHRFLFSILNNSSIPHSNVLQSLTSHDKRITISLTLNSPRVQTLSFKLHFASCESIAQLVLFNLTYKERRVLNRSVSDSEFRMPFVSPAWCRKTVSPDNFLWQRSFTETGHSPLTTFSNRTFSRQFFDHEK